MFNLFVVIIRLGVLSLIYFAFLARIVYRLISKVDPIYAIFPKLSFIERKLKAKRLKDKIEELI